MSEAFVLTSPETQQERRNYRAELQHSRTELVSTMVRLREARLDPSPEVIATAQFLIFMGLPNRRTLERTIRKSSRLPDGSKVVVTFHANDDGVDLPFGADVNLLHWLINKAIMSASPFISWKTAQEYLDWANKQKGGTATNDLRERFARINGLSITIQRTDATDVEKFRMSIIRASRLPKSVKREEPAVEEETSSGGDQKADVRPRGLMFDEAFFSDFIKHNVPMLKALLLLVSDRPQLQQYIGFLGYRSYAASSATFIPWETLKEQIWYKDSNKARMKTRFEETILLLRIAWPELQAEARKKGLWIAPPLKGVQFIAALPSPSRRVDPTRPTVGKRRIGMMGERTGLFSVDEIARGTEIDVERQA